MLISAPDELAVGLNIEVRFEDRAAKPCGTRPVPGEPGLTGVWPGLGLAGVPGRVTDST